MSESGFAGFLNFQDSKMEGILKMFLHAYVPSAPDFVGFPNLESCKP